MSAKGLQAGLRDLGNPEDAAFAALYFKPSSGQRVEGDRLIDIRVIFIVVIPPTR